MTSVLARRREVEAEAALELRDAAAVFVQDEIDDGRSKASLLLVAGGQVQFGRAAIFLQANATPAQTRSLWNRGGVAQLEGGFRFNLAPAREY